MGFDRPALTFESSAVTFDRSALSKRGLVDQIKAERCMVARQLEEERTSLAAQQERANDYRDARLLIQSVAQDVQTKAYRCIASVVSRCLEAVFVDPYQFEMRFVQKRGRTEVELGFRREGNDLDPMSAAGGGVVDVASFGLRVAALLISSGLRKTLILDEPFKFVSAGYRKRIAELLTTLADELGLQFIIVSHIDEFRVGNVIELGEK